MAATASFAALQPQLAAELWSVVHVSLIESCLIHLRNVDDFLGQQPARDEVAAVHYLPSWTQRPFLTATERHDINGALSHLTRRRLGPNPRGRLVPLARRGVQTFGAFVACLDPAPADLFRDALDEAERALAMVPKDGPSKAAQEAPEGP